MAELIRLDARPPSEGRLLWVSGLSDDFLFPMSANSAAMTMPARLSWITGSGGATVARGPTESPFKHRECEDEPVPPRWRYSL